MPTPFSHLAVAQRLFTDPTLPEAFRTLLMAERGAFLLGNVAADARVGAGTPREVTHFYAYGQPLDEAPWRVMLRQYPMLWTPHSASQRAFVAGYVAHLCMDEIWSKEMVGPHFAAREWGDRMFRFYMLHIILIYMDERDFAQLEHWQPEHLQRAQPDNWLPFIPDDDLRRWQLLIYDQIKPEGSSQTLEIFGDRIARTPQEMRAFLDSGEDMQRGLWDHIPRTTLAEIEGHMYAHARTEMLCYLDSASAADAEVPSASSGVEDGSA